MDTVAVAANAPLVGGRSSGSRFYLWMACTTLAVATIGFGPGLLDPATRNLPVTPLVTLHAALSTSWLLLFLAQTLLVTAGRTPLHRRLGPLGGVLAVVMIPVGFATTIAMGRRGIALSKDLDIVADPLYQMVFPLGDILTFGVLVAAALHYRRRPQVHKRLMLLATVAAMMPAPLAHLIGHYPVVSSTPGIIVLPLGLLLFASAAYDHVALGRMHPVSLWGAVLLFAWANLRAVVIGPSDAWHVLAAWLIR